MEEEEKIYLADDADLLGEDPRKAPAEEQVIAEGQTDEDFIDHLEITFEKYDGTKEVYEVLSVFTDLSEKHRYMAMALKDAEDPTEVSLVPFEYDEDGEVMFRDFESDEEYAAAEKAWISYHTEENAASGEAGEPVSAEETVEELPEEDKEWIRDMIREVKEL